MCVLLGAETTSSTATSSSSTSNTTSSSATTATTSPPQQAQPDLFSNFMASMVQMMANGQQVWTVTLGAAACHAQQETAAVKVKGSFLALNNTFLVLMNC